jgi:hypothetical protein
MIMTLIEPILLIFLHFYDTILGDKCTFQRTHILIRELNCMLLDIVN